MTPMNPDFVQIRRARADEVVDLRHVILRAGLGRATAEFDGDHDAQTIHIAGFTTENVVVACASFLRRDHPDSREPAWQLRGMAVRQDLQGRRLGARLLEFGERAIREHDGPRLLWCNARIPAAAFYERNGWTRQGDEFIVETAGPHVRMFKRLSSG